MASHWNIPLNLHTLQPVRAIEQPCPHGLPDQCFAAHGALCGSLDIIHVQVHDLPLIQEQAYTLLAQMSAPRLPRESSMCDMSWHCWKAGRPDTSVRPGQDLGYDRVMVEGSSWASCQITGGLQAWNSQRYVSQYKGGQDRVSGGCTTIVVVLIERKDSQKHPGANRYGEIPQQ